MVKQGMGPTSFKLRDFVNICFYDARISSVDEDEKEK